MPDQIQLLRVFKYVNFHGVGIKKMRNFIQAINADLKVAIVISRSGLISLPFHHYCLIYN